MTSCIWIHRYSSSSQTTGTHQTEHSIVGRFYDPLGFLSPIVIRYKMLFQELCEKGQDWDQPLKPKLLAKWKELIEELEHCPVMSLPRCIWNGSPTEGVSCSLHGFCDASKHAYAAVVYLILKSPTGQTVRFIASKTRVSPLKPQTIPRLELLLLARLMKSVPTSLGTEMQLEEPICYTDCEVSLYWIRGVDRVWKQFVQHRVVEIRNLFLVLVGIIAQGLTTQLIYPLEVLTQLNLPGMTCG